MGEIHGYRSWLVLAVVVAVVQVPCTGFTADWSTTEIQLQYGNLESAFGGKDLDTTIITFQNASAWKYGDNFLFVDVIRTENDNTNLYGEWYPSLSVGKIMGKNTFGGALRDVGLIIGINFDSDANVFKYLPGVRLSWDLPGFAFLNTDFMAYIDNSGGMDSGGAPKEDDSWMIDVNWALPFRLASLNFGFEGHMEYIAERDNELGGKAEGWFLAQPQFRIDIGELIFKKPDVLFAGIEYQYWINKLGDGDTDESAVQALLVWRL